MPAPPPPFTPEPAAPPFEPTPRGDEPQPFQVNRSYFGWPGIIALAGLAYLIWSDARADGRLLGDLIAALTSAWLPILLLALFGLVSWVINAGLDRPGSRRRIAATLRLDRGGALYRTTMRDVLDWIDSKLSWEQQAQGKPPEHWGIAWSPRLFEGCLLLAISYPIYSVFAFWALTDSTATVGTYEVVQGEQPIWMRLVIVGGLVVTLGLGLLSGMRRSKGNATGAYLYLALAVAAAFVSTSTGNAIHGTVALGGAAGFSVAVIVASAVVTVFAAATFAFITIAIVIAAQAFAGTDRLEPMIALVTATSLAATTAIIALVGFAFFRDQRIGRWGRRSLSEFIIVSAIAAVIADLAYSAGAHRNAALFWTLPLVLGVFFWAAKSVEALYECGPKRYGYRGIFAALFVVALVCSLITMSIFIIDNAARILLLFFGFLPLLNAVYDFASLGLTRFCLRRGLKPGFLMSLRWSIADTVAALALFAGLVLSAILLVHHVENAMGAPLASLNAIFAGIARAPESYWWLYLTFFSTLIPTLLHLGVASFSFIALAPAPLQRKVADWVRRMDDDGFANIRVRTILPLLWTLSLALPFLALYTLGLWIADYHGDVGWMFFRLALGFAEWLDPAYVVGVEEIIAGKKP